MVWWLYDFEAVDGNPKLQIRARAVGNRQSRSVVIFNVCVRTLSL